MSSRCRFPLGLSVVSLIWGAGSVALAGLTGAQIGGLVESGAGLVWQDTAADWRQATGPGVGKDGVDALMSPAGAGAAGVAVSGNVTGPGVLRGWMRVSSEPLQDELILTLDGLAVKRWSGEQQGDFEYRIPRGAHTVGFRWSKDETLAAGADAAWVDAVDFTPDATTVPEALDVAGTPGAARVVFTVPSGYVGWSPILDPEALRGGDVLFSPGVSGGTAPRGLLATLTGPGIALFRAKPTLGESVLPTVLPRAGAQLLEKGVEGGWTTYRIFLPGPTGEVLVTHPGNSFSAAPGAGVFLDAWDIGPQLSPPSIGEALDDPGRVFTAAWGSVNGGPATNAAWVAVPAGAGTGLGREDDDLLLAPLPELAGNATRVGATRDLTTQVTGPGRLSFWCRRPAGSVAISNALSGEVVDPSGAEPARSWALRTPSAKEWQERVLEIPPGLRTVTLRWSSTDVLALNEWVWTPTPRVAQLPATAGNVTGLTVSSAGNWSGAAWSQAGWADGNAIFWNPLANESVTDSPAHAFQATATGGGWLSFASQTSDLASMRWWLDGTLLEVGRYFSLSVRENPSQSWKMVARRLSAGSHAISWAPDLGARASSTGAVRLDAVGLSNTLPEWLAAMEVPDTLDHWEMTGGAWMRDAVESHDGEDALRGPALSAGGQAELLARMTGPGTLRFWWKVGDPGRSAGLSNSLRFDIGGNPPVFLDTPGEWREHIVHLRESVGFLAKWQFTRSDRPGMPGDGVWLDGMSFTPATAVALAEAMDTAGRVWTSSGDVQGLSGGGLAAATGQDLVRINATAPPAPAAWLGTTLTEGGVASFRSYGLGQVRVNGALVPLSSWGGRSWFQVTGPGPHVCQFECSATLGQADFDDFQFTPLPLVTLPEALDNPAATTLAVTGFQGGSYGVADAAASSDGVDALRLEARSSASGIYSPSYLEAFFNGPARVRFRWRSAGPGTTQVTWPSETPGAGNAENFEWTLMERIVTATGSNRLLIKAEGNSGTESKVVWVDQLSVEPMVSAPLHEALNISGLTFTTGGPATWAGLRPPGAAPSPAPGDGSYAWVRVPASAATTPAWLQTTVTGPGWLAFTPTVSGATQTRLEMTTDGAASILSGNRIFVPDGSHTVRWSARYLTAAAAGVPSAELRDVKFEPAVPLADALDAPGVAFTTTADPGKYWYASARDAADTGFLQVGTLARVTGAGTLSTLVSGPGWLRFEAGWPTRPSGSAAWPAGTSVRVRLLPPPPAPVPSPLPAAVFDYTSAFSTTTGVYREGHVWIPPGSWQAQFAFSQGGTLNRFSTITSLPDAAAAAVALNLPPDTALTLYPAQASFSAAPVSRDGVQALQLATSAAGTTPVIGIPVTGPAVISGWTRTAIAAPVPSLTVVGAASYSWGISDVSVRLDGVPVASSWGVPDANGWQFWQLPVTAPGPHTVAFALTAPFGSPGSRALLQLDEISLSSLAEVPLTEAMDRPEWAWTTGGTAAWKGFASAAASPDGTDAAWLSMPPNQSAPPAVDAPSYMETNVTGPGLLKLALRGSGFVTIQAGGKVFDPISASSGQVPLLLPAGTQPLRISALTQSGKWGVFGVDFLSWQPGALTDFAAALDAPDLAFTTSGASPESWQPMALPAESVDGGDSLLFLGAPAGPAYLQTTVSGPAILAFQYRVESTVALSVSVDSGAGQLLPSVSQPGGWNRAEYLIPAGAHTVQWKLEAQPDTTTPAGSAPLRLDALTLTPILPAPVPTLAEALDQPGWTAAASAPTRVRAMAFTPSSWYPQDAVLMTPLAAGTVPDAANPVPSLTLRVPGPGVLHYRRRPFGSQAGQGTSDGTSWEDVSFPVTAGPMDFTWSTTTGQAGYWLDDVWLEPLLTPAAATGLPAGAWTFGGSAGTWAGVPSSLGTGGSAVPSKAVTTLTGAGNAWAELQITGPGRLTFSAQSATSSAGIYLDGLRIDDLSLTSTGACLIVPAGVHRCRWSLTDTADTGGGGFSLWNVAFAPAAVADPVAAAMDAPDLPWLLKGPISSWQPTADATAAGGSVLTYTAEANTPAASLSTVLPAPSDISLRIRAQAPYPPQIDNTSVTENWASYPIPYGTLGSTAWVISLRSGTTLAQFDGFAFTPVSTSLATAMDDPGRVWETSPTAPYTGFSTATPGLTGDGVDAVMPLITTGGAWLQTTVTGPARFAFRPKDATGRFLLNGVSHAILRGVSWQANVFEVGPGTHVLRWEDTGPLDGFTVAGTAGETTLAEALDYPAVWRTTAEMRNTVSTTDTADGQDAVFTPADLLAISAFAVELEGPGRLEFSAKGPWSPTPPVDYAIFIQNSAGFSEKWPGLPTPDWSDNVVESIPPGRQLVQWPVRPGSSAANYLARDRVRFTPYAPATLAEALDAPSLAPVSSPGDAWKGWAAGAAALDSGDAVTCGSVSGTWLEITLPPGAGELRVMARRPSYLDSTNPTGLHLSTGGTAVSRIVPRAWKLLTYPVAASASRTARFTSNGNNLWLDRLQFLPAADALATWLTAHDLPATADLNADSDGDGLTVIMEYALGLDPTQPRAADPGMAADAGPPVFQFVPAGSGTGYLTCTYLRRTGGLGLTYEVKYSSEPSTASASAPAAVWTTVQPVNDGWERVIVKDLNANGSIPAGPRFGRLWVTYAP